jgi:hypothetical protein
LRTRCPPDDPISIAGVATCDPPAATEDPATTFAVEGGLGAGVVVEGDNGSGEEVEVDEGPTVAGVEVAGGETGRCRPPACAAFVEPKPRAGVTIAVRRAANTITSRSFLDETCRTIRRKVGSR